MRLSHMTRMYRRPLLASYLLAPPKEDDRGEDFLNVGAERSFSAQTDVDALVRDHPDGTSRRRF